MASKAVPNDAELRAGHRQRLRARFLESPSSLPDSDLLELALGHVYVRRDNKMTARRLLARFGSLAAVLAATPDELDEVPGCGPSLLPFFTLLREIIARSVQSEVQGKQAVTFDDLLVMGRERLKFAALEEVWVALLDKQNRLLKFMKIRHGSFDHVALEPRELVELMIQSRASSVVLMHNHPGGSFMPSIEDRQFTGRISLALKALDLHLHDHVIITPEACFSIVRDRRLEMPTKTRNV